MIFARRCPIWGLLACFLATAAPGCGRNGTPLARVDGQIKFSGAPIEKGTILFVPSDGRGPASGADIAHGEFSALVPPGPKRIEVRSPKVVGQRKKPEAEGPVSPADLFEEQIPATYNAKSTLAKDIQLPETRIELDLQP